MSEIVPLSLKNRNQRVDTGGGGCGGWLMWEGAYTRGGVYVE